MPENKADEVFNKLSLTPTVRKVPEPGVDGHALIDGSKSAWNGGIINTTFINNLSGGQEQNLVLSADHVVHVQNSQIVINTKGAKYNRATGDNDHFGGKPDSRQSRHADRPGSGKE